MERLQVGEWFYNKKNIMTFVRVLLSCNVDWCCVWVSVHLLEILWVMLCHYTCVLGPLSVILSCGSTVNTDWNCPYA
jgi:hypothetical protein